MQRAIEFTFEPLPPGGGSGSFFVSGAPPRCPQSPLGLCPRPLTLRTRRHRQVFAVTAALAVTLCSRPRSAAEFVINAGDPVEELYFEVETFDLRAEQIAVEQVSVEETLTMSLPIFD